ncbi:hypothetical protein SNE40_005598 [Patella caerulea]|uniref:Ubiquitin-like protease family profile domain-containing protein n=2 Tax=Patella caerulea TaxID=87958 RepID=A0AAN8K231_PATCE
MSLLKAPSVNDQKSHLHGVWCDYSAIGDQKHIMEDKDDVWPQSEVGTKDLESSSPQLSKDDKKISAEEKQTIGGESSGTSEERVDKPSSSGPGMKIPAQTDHNEKDMVSVKVEAKNGETDNSQSLVTENMTGPEVFIKKEVDDQLEPGEVKAEDFADEEEHDDLAGDEYLDKEEGFEEGEGYDMYDGANGQEEGYEDYAENNGQQEHDQGYFGYPDNGLMETGDGHPGMSGEDQEQYYYGDGEEYYEDEEYADNEYVDENDENEDKDTIREVVKGPNGRLQYVMKGLDGRIKCIMDAPMDATESNKVDKKESENEANYGTYEGENDDNYAEEGEEEYYEEEGHDYVEDKQEYEEGEIPNPYRNNPPRTKPLTHEEKEELCRVAMAQYSDEGFDYMDDEDEEYYDDDEDEEFPDNLTQEQLTVLRQQHIARQEHLAQMRSQENQMQQINTVKKDQATNKNNATSSDIKAAGNPADKRAQEITGRKPSYEITNSSGKPSSATEQEEEMDEEYIDDEAEDENYEETDEEYNRRKQLYDQQRLKNIAQLQHPSGSNHSQTTGQHGEEYYDDDEEEEYFDEDEECSDDSAIEAFIQQAIEKQKEAQLKNQRLGMENPSNQNPNIKPGIPISPPTTNETIKKLDVQMLSNNSSQDGTPNNSSVKNNLLNNLSFNNLKFKDGEGPVQNMVYLIRSNQGRDVYAMWDGQKFVPTPLDISLALPSEALTDSQKDSKIVGGGAKGKVKGPPLKGNATGLNMVDESDEAVSRSARPIPRNSNMVSLASNRKASPVPNNNEGDLLPNGRVWHHTNKSSLARRPLHPTPPLGEEEDEMDEEDEEYIENDISNSGSTSSVKRHLDGVVKYAACKSCGYSSSDLDKCERCFRKLPVDAKVHVVDKIKNSQSDYTIDRKSFYGHKLNDQSQPYKYAKLSNHRQPLHSPQGENVQFDNRKVRATYGQRIKKQKPNKLHNVKITISSDEEDSNSNETLPIGATGNSSQDFQSNSRCDSPIFPHSKVSSPSQQETGSIRNRMEDQNGKVKSKKSKPPAFEENLEPLTDCTLSLNARSVRIGSLKSKPLEPVMMSDKGFSCSVVCERKGNHKCRIEIDTLDIVSCQGHLNPPVVVMFLELTTAGGVKLREKLKMKANQRSNFDPDSQDKKLKYCVIIFDTLEDPKSVKQIIQHYQIVNKAGPSYYQELTHEEANMLLLQTTPLTPAMQAQVGLTMNKDPPVQPAIQNIRDTSSHGDEQEYNRDEMENFENAELREESCSPSPPRVTFTGPLEKLLTYPPPPAKGALTITNEDLYCLNDGEFLNDVIIDFYLKYLLLEKLSEKDKQRTHIFSSFFYKRLTHRLPKMSESTADINKQPHVKRHSKVKTWTRHVDLFEKDFIIVPINEHSHWFLAIICFPGLEEPQFCPFLPVPLKPPPPPPPKPATPTSSPESASAPATTQSTGEESSQDSANNPVEPEPETETPMEVENLTPSKVITGIPLDPEKCIEESCNREYCLGKKQPCILIFDSLAGPSRASVCKTLKEYLQVEWSIKKDTERNFKDFRGSSPKVPQQNNYSDCGIYVLQYVESFFQSPIMDFTVPMKGLDYWFHSEVCARKREEIKSLVLKLQELYPRPEKKS